MRWIIFSLLIWATSIGASAYGQMRPDNLWSENFFTLSFFILLLPYPIWYIRSALAARKFGYGTRTTKACLIFCGLYLMLCLLMSGILVADIFLQFIGMKSDIPIVNFNAAAAVIGLLIIVNLVAVILATASLRAAETAVHGNVNVINPLLCFFAFFYLPIGMFFLKSRLENLEPDTTFD